MAWKLPWSTPDPIARRQQELAAQAARLEEEARALEEEVASLTRPPVDSPADSTPPVPIWSESEEDSFSVRPRHRAPNTDRVLQAHQHRDRNLFIGLATLLSLVVLWWILR